MERIDFSLTFFDRENPDRQFSNQMLYDIRKEVARCMETAGFGAVLENGPEKFSNTWAVPTDDFFVLPENHLFISFSWRAPILHGNFASLVMDAIPHLHQFIRDNFHKNLVASLNYF